MSLQQTLIQTSQVTLNVAEGPPNGPLLLLLPGLANTWRIFKPILPALISGWQVLSFDYRGHGLSSRKPGEYRGMAFFSDACEFVQKFISRPAALLSHSFGGAMAMQLAIDFPEKIRGLVVGDTPFDINDHVEKMNQPIHARTFSLRRRLAGRPVGELTRRRLPAGYVDELHHLDPGVLEYYAESRAQEFFRDAQNVDYTQIQCPTLVVQANPEKGGLLPDSDVKRAKTLRPDFHYLQVDTGHELDIEKGTESPFFMAAKGFLDKIPL
jgi:pimeloyl-ACP methyl ester carboxylesterase